jgi:hypothetical protein
MRWIDGLQLVCKVVEKETWCTPTSAISASASLTSHIRNSCLDGCSRIVVGVYGVLHKCQEKSTTFSEAQLINSVDSPYNLYSIVTVSIRPALI